LRLPRDCTYCLPVLHDDGRLRFAPWRARRGARVESPRHPGTRRRAFRAAAREAMAFVSRRSSGFDARGHRLGMGGGWYDRSFAFRRDAPRRRTWSAPRSPRSRSSRCSRKPGTCRSMRCAPTATH
jgi:5-formyltetrahydrofolate cyclo-ligase